MKLLTLNCHSWLEDNQLEKIQTIVQEIKSGSYDVIALQEVNQSIDEAFITENIKANNFGYVLLEELSKLGVNDYKMIWDFSHIAYNKYEEGLCLLTRHEVVDQYSFYISKNHDKNYWKTRKIVGAAIRINNSLIDFYSCHLGWWEDEEEPFVEQADLLFENIPLDKPTFLMGDFNNNALTKGQGYDYLIQKGMYDTFELAKQKDEGITVRGKIAGWEVNKSDLRLDLILVNQKVDVKYSRVVFNDLNKPIVSDHYGVEIESQ